MFHLNLFIIPLTLLFVNPFFEKSCLLKIFCPNNNTNKVSQKNHIDKLWHNTITHRKYVDFLIGENGNFDLLALVAVNRAFHSYGYGNIHFILVLPYMKIEYHDNKKDCLDYMMKSRYVPNRS